MTAPPILYSFRRCPYAMRARMALIAAEVELEHREILLKDKPPEMLEASPKGTVPVLVLEDGVVLDQSWDIVQWAITKNDPYNWLGTNHEFLTASVPLVESCDGEFKSALDRYKYADRHPLPAQHYREQAMPFLQHLDQQLKNHRYLLTDRITVADIAILPFVRQFANVDRSWFDQCGLNHLTRWLEVLLSASLFAQAMRKFPVWEFTRPGEVA